MPSGLAVLDSPFCFSLLSLTQAFCQPLYNAAETDSLVVSKVGKVIDRVFIVSLLLAL